MGVHVTASAITVRVQDAAGLSVGSSWVRVAVPQIIKIEQSGVPGEITIDDVGGLPTVLDGLDVRVTVLENNPGGGADTTNLLAPGTPTETSHTFSRDPDGPINGIATNGPGAGAHLSWIDGRTAVGESIDAFVEAAHVIGGLLQHRGTKLVASVAVPIKAGRWHSVSMGYSEPIAGPGGGYPTAGTPESGYSSSRISFVDGIFGANGYVAYIQSGDNESNHSMVIVRDTEMIPEVIAGPWDLGRRLTTSDSWSFSHDGNLFEVALNGAVVGSVIDEMYDYTTLVLSGIVLNTGSLWLPNVPWWSISGGSPSTHQHPATDISTDPAATGITATDVEGALTELAARPSGGLWEVVSTQTLDATSPAVSFTGLEEFKEVEIRWSGRVTSNSAQASYLQIQFNGDTSANYERSIFYRQSSFVSLNESTQTSGWVGRISGSQVNANRRSFGKIYVPCDQPSADHKTAYGDFSCLASTSTQVAVGSAAVGWADTTEAITSLTLSPADGQFQIGFKFELLGRR